jgi:3-oxoacyl-[acyl-carrier-protein] synthase II
MVASIGATGGEVFDALCAGRSGLAPLRGFDPALFRAQHAYEIPEPTRAVGADRPLRATDLLCQAISEALADAGADEDLSGIPVLIGTGLRELRTAELWWTEAVPLDPADLHFGTALRTVFGAAATHTFSNACSASLYALGLGSDLLASGAADTVVVAGVDVITESMFALLDRVHPEPVDSVRPFDRNRKGVLMGDGAAAVVLRSADSGPAKAWLRGVGLNCDAYHVTAPDPAGMIAAMRQAHALSGVTPAEVDLVLAHGTGTLRNDEAEAFALAEAFAGLPISPLVTAVKSMTGHTSGSSGLMSLVVAVSCLATGMVPPTIGLVDPVEEADGLRFVTDGPVRSGPRLAQVDAFGFGGVNAVAVVERGE